VKGGTIAARLVAADTDVRGWGKASDHALDLDRAHRQHGKPTIAQSRA